MPATESNPPQAIKLGGYCWAFFGTVMAIVGFVKGQDWPTALAIGFLSGGAFAVLLVLLARYQQMGRSFQEEDIELTEPQRRAASRAATRGPVPQDPDVRRAAFRTAVYRLEQLSRHMTLWVSVFSGIFVLEVTLAIMVDPLHWLGAVVASVAVVARLGAQMRLRRRVALLNIIGPAPEPGPAPDPGPAPEPVPGH